MKHKTQPLLLLKLFLLVTTLTQISRWMAENDTEDTASDAAFFMLCNVALGGMARLLCTPSPVSAAGTESWVTVMGETNDIWGQSIQQTSSGNYISASMIQNDENEWDVLISQLGSRGGLSSSKTLNVGYTDSSDIYTPWACFIQKTANGDYVLSTTTSNYGAGDNDALIAIVDSEGERKKWVEALGGSSEDYAMSAQELDEGGYVFTGSTYSSGAGLDDAWVCWLDQYGNVSSSKTFGGSDTDESYFILQTSDGGYAFTGVTASYGDTDGDAWVVKLDSDGNLSWVKTFGGSEVDSGRCIRETADGAYILSGRTKSSGAGDDDAFIAKFDSDGNFLWAKTLGGFSTDYGDSLQETSDGDYILVGLTYSYGKGSGDVYIAKFDSDGNLLWAKTLGGSYRDRGFDIQETSDTNYVLTGFTFNSEGKAEVLSVKITKDGELVDSDLPPNLVLLDYTDEISLATWSPDISTISPTVGDFTVTVTNVTSLISYETTDITVSWISPTGTSVDSLLTNGKALKIPGPMAASSFGGSYDGSNNYLGDLNHDGIDDFGITSLRYNQSSDGSTYLTPGAAYIFYGRKDFLDQQSRITNNLTDYLNGTAGFQVIAPNSVGLSVSNAGDLNDDGWPDLIFGNVFYNITSELCAFVLFGGENVGLSGVINLAQLNGTNGFFIYTPTMPSYDGTYLYRVSAHGIDDFDGDGYNDLAIGTVYWDNWKGMTYIISGYSTIGKQGAFYLNQSEHVMTVFGESQLNALGEGSQFGHVKPIGDINNDGNSDVLISATAANAGHAYGYDYHNGTTYVLLGGQWTETLNVTTMNSSWGFAITGAKGEELGTSLARLDDINGDGIDDIMIGGPRYCPSDCDDNPLLIGNAYFISGDRSFGQVDIEINLQNLGEDEGYVIPGTNTKNYYQLQNGIGVSRTGYRDIRDKPGYIVGAYSSYPDNLGSVYLITYNHDIVTNGQVNYTALTDEQLTVIIGSERDDYFGDTVQFVGDVNGDCVDDVAIGAPSADENGQKNSGFVLLYFGDSTNVTYCGDPTVNDTVMPQQVDVCTYYHLSVKPYFQYTVPTRGQLTFMAYQTTPAGNQSLPSWLTFNSTTARFVGTPRYVNETGTNNITVVLTDYYGETSLDFTLNVQGVAPSDGENPISAQFAKVGVPFSLNSTDYEPFTYITDCPNTVSYDVVEANSNQLPTWLNLNSLSRGFRLTGTPYAEHEGITTIAYTIVDNYGNLTRYFNITTNATLFMVDDNRGSYTLNWPSKPFENITLASDAARATLNATFVITPENAGSVSVTEPDPVTTDGNLEMINAAFSSLCLQPSDNFSNNITIAVYVTDDFHQSATRNFTLLGINAAQGPWCGPPKARSVLPSRTMDVCTDKIFNVSLTEAFYYTAGQSDDALHMSTQVDYSSSSTGWVRTVTTNSVWQLYATPNQPGHTGTTQITLVLNDAYGEATNDFDLTVSGVAPKTIQPVDDTAVNIGDVTLYPDNTPFEEISSSTCTSNPVYTTTQINGNPLPAWITGSINSYQLQINPCDIVGKEKISVLTNLTNNYGWASVNYSIEATGSLDTNVGESVNSCEFTTESQCALYQGNFDIRTPYLIKTESDGAISVQIVVEIDNPEQFDGCTLTTPSGDTSSGQSIVSTYDNKTYTWSVSGAYQNDDNNIMNTILYDIYIECSSPPSHTWNPLVFNFSAIDSCSQRSNVTTSVYYYKSTPSPSPAPVATSSTAFTLDSSAQGGVSMVGGVLFTALLSCICLYTRKRHLLTSRREVEMLRQALIDFITAHNPQGTRQQPLEELFEKLKESTLAYARRNSAQMGIDTKQGGINSEWQQDDTANLENQRIRGLSNAFQQTFDKTSVEALYNSEETFFKIALLYLFENPGASLLKLNLLQLYTTLFEKMDNHAALGASKRIHYLHILTRLTELLILSLNDITLDRKYEIYYSLQRFTTNISRTENDHSKINFYCSLKLTQDLILWMRDNTHTATFLPAVQNRPRFIKDPKQLLRFPKRWVLPIIEMHQKLPWAIEKLAACQDLQRVAMRCKDWESLYLTINILEQIACKTTDNTIVSAILTRPEGTKQLGLHEIAQFAANRQLSNPGYRWVKQRVKHALLTIAQKQKGSEITNLIGSIEVDINQLSKKLSVRLSEVGIFATPFASNSDDHSGQEMNLIQKRPGDISSL